MKLTNLSYPFVTFYNYDVKIIYNLLNCLSKLKSGDRIRMGVSINKNRDWVFFDRYFYLFGLEKEINHKAVNGQLVYFDICVEQNLSILPVHSIISGSVNEYVKLNSNELSYFNTLDSKVRIDLINNDWFFPLKIFKAA